MYTEMIRVKGQTTLEELNKAIEEMYGFVDFFENDDAYQAALDNRAIECSKATDFDTVVWQEEF